MVLDDRVDSVRLVLSLRYRRVSRTRRVRRTASVALCISERIIGVRLPLSISSCASSLAWIGSRPVSLVAAVSSAIACTSRIWRPQIRRSVWKVNELLSTSQAAVAWHQGLDHWDSPENRVFEMNRLPSRSGRPVHSLIREPIQRQVSPIAFAVMMLYGRDRARQTRIYPRQSAYRRRTEHFVPMKPCEEVDLR